jgi:hypothetical protein
MRIVSSKEEKKEYPIQMIVPVHNRVVGSGFTVVYTAEDGKSESVSVWTSLSRGAACDGVKSRVDKLRFTEEGGNRIVGRNIIEKKRGWFSARMDTRFEIDEIILRRGLVLAEAR